MSPDGASGRSATTSWSPGGGLEVHDQGSPFSRKEDKEKPLLGFVNMNRNQLAEKARQLQIPVSGNHTRRHLINIIREDLIQQSTPKGSDHLGFGKHGTKKYQEVLHLIEQVEDHQSHWKLKRFSSWLKMQNVFQETNLENNMAQERMTRRIRQLDKRRKTPEQEGATLNYGIGGGEHRAEGTSTITDDVFSRAWSSEFGRELCGMAELAVRKK